MFDHIVTKLAPEMIVGGSVLFGLLVLFAWRWPEICFALGFPAYIFLGQLKQLLPVSNSAGAALFLIAAVIGTVMQGRKFHFGHCEKLIIGLALLMALSLSYSSNPTYGRDKTILFCFMVVPLIIFLPNIIANIKSLQVAVFIIVLTLVIYVFASVLLRLQMSSIEGRISALFGVIQAGQFLGLGVIISWLYINLRRRGDPRRIFFFYLSLLSALLLFMTGTRVAILAIVVTMLFTYWFMHIDWLKRIINQPHKTYITIVLGALILLTSSFALKRTLPEGVYSRYTSIEHFFSNFTPDKIRYWQDSRSRTLNYFSAVEGFLSNPLRGLGAGGYVDALGKYHRIRILTDGIVRAYPHNVVLEFAVEQGILGLVLIFCVLYLNLKIILRLRKLYHGKLQDRFLICFCVSIYVYGLCVSMTSLDIPRMMILWWGMGLLLAADKIYAKRESNSSHCQRMQNHKYSYFSGDIGIAKGISCNSNV
ncbi:MAG: hypothetical protein CEE38_22185 [Planctomycetes bacterium B3_Pla]|nr:MAG: hypothetical protein CEE38_22185 [Planctomycetes bacterium B3_Pla]